MPGVSSDLLKRNCTTSAWPHPAGVGWTRASFSDKEGWWAGSSGLRVDKFESTEDSAPSQGTPRSLRQGLCPFDQVTLDEWCSKRGSRCPQRDGSWMQREPVRGHGHHLGNTLSTTHPSPCHPLTEWSPPLFPSHTPGLLLTRRLPVMFISLRWPCKSAPAMSTGFWISHQGVLFFTSFYPSCYGYAKIFTEWRKECPKVGKRN